MMKQNNYDKGRRLCSAGSKAFDSLTAVPRETKGKGGRSFPVG